jgi:hypothetical protein
MSDLPVGATIRDFVKRLSVGWRGGKGILNRFQVSGFRFGIATYRHNAAEL